MASQSPRNNLYFHRAFQYRPTVTKTERGGNTNSAESRIKVTLEDHHKGFPCGIFQSPGSSSADLAGGPAAARNWHMYCDPRVLRQEDVIRAPAYYPNLAFKVESWTHQAAVGEMDAFMFVTMIAIEDQEE